MSLLDTLRSAVKIADNVTRPVQSTVTFHRRLTSDKEGTSTFAAPVALRAVVDWKATQVRTPQGVLTSSRASVTFLDVAKLSSATGGNGVSDLDRIVLPDGTTGPILNLSGFVDAGTGRPVATEVFLG